MTKLYLFSKTVHRILVMAISFITLIMALSGILLKYPSLSSQTSLDLRLIRYIHNNLSPFFSVMLTIMVVTGIIMYVYPLSRRRS